MASRQRTKRPLAAPGVNDWSAALLAAINRENKPRLDEREWKTMLEIADELGLSPSHASRRVRIMRKHGLLEQQTDFRQTNRGMYRVPVYRLKNTR